MNEVETKFPSECKSANNIGDVEIELNLWLGAETISPANESGVVTVINSKDRWSLTYYPLIETKDVSSSKGLGILGCDSGLR